VNGELEGTLRVLEIETFGRGGLIHYAYNLTRALAERGHRLDLVTAVGYELVGRELPAGVRLHTLIGRVGSRLGARSPAAVAGPIRKIEAVLDAIAVSRLAGRIDPDVIHLHSTNTSAVAYLSLLKRLGVPLVATAHVVTPHEPVPFQTSIYRRIHAAPDLVIAHSEFDRARLRDEFRVAPERSTVIPHGEYGFFADVDGFLGRVEARRKLGLGTEEPVALFFGYLREYKGLDVLLDAWPEVLDGCGNARLVIAGDPFRLPADRRHELRRRADELDAIHRFEYIPFAEVGNFFAAADVLVMPYRRISQSGVLYLALSLGVPVVASAVGALPEMLTDGDSALLVPPEAPAALAAAVSRALGDRPLRERLARGGRGVADAHSWPAVAARTERVFGELVGRSAVSELE
jgi:glycosyltransferase involved in cell wall biosynthesis